MNVIHRRGWEIPESLATPEHLFFNRRAFLGAAAGAAARRSRRAARSRSASPTCPIRPRTSIRPSATRNTRSTAPITPEEINGDYNNFYEFGSSKTIAKAAQALKLRPWTIKIDGMVEKPIEIGIDDLIRKMPLEERLYRHRCVEAWSMAIPWIGISAGQAGRAREAAVVGEISS